MSCYRVLSCVALGLMLSACLPAKADPPNVLLILVDDLKPSFGAYGADWVHSPNLDRLADRGMRFNFAYCNQAVCAPSRNNLMTGSRSTSLGVYGLSMNFRRAVPDAVTMPQFFRKHGYTAEGVGKVFHIGHGNTDDTASWSTPFFPEKVIDYALPESNEGKLTREEAYFSNQELGRIHELPRGAAWERADVPDDAYSDGRIANEGIRRLQQAKESDQPFFLALGFVKPHLPFCAPEKYWALYDDVDLPIATVRDYPVGAPSYAPKDKHGELNQYKPIPQDPPLDPAVERNLVQGYYSALSYMDAQVGRVIDEVDRLGLAENTIIVLWGDHGYHLGDHGMWTKHTNYEQANRIPIIFAGPGVARPGSESDALVETVDIYPTLAALAGLPTPEGPQPIDGESLAGILQGSEQAVRDHAYHAFPRGGGRIGQAVRTHRYRLVEWKQFRGNDPPEYELYDYETDPLETRNLADDKPEIVAELKKMLDTHPEAVPAGGLKNYLKSQAAKKSP
ncbi:sulfatase [Aeoliella mucimassa]|uniref:Choline-sulfatase n=1 Tax=Aeoliella mucimassa TaxID=2527972 RepID=A0A518ANC3_9BACT|nr:sulfatase [Aeoliella mucimassa]QDU56220.1 Choline-sulfatase [Aeoliella mucimassa]